MSCAADDVSLILVTHSLLAVRAKRLLVASVILADIIIHKTTRFCQFDDFVLAEDWARLFTETSRLRYLC